MPSVGALINVPTSAALYDAALEGLTRLDERMIETGAVPRLYDAGVRYKTEPREVWRHAVDVATEGWGDCEDLSAYRAAELRVSGEDPSAAVATYQTGPRRYHAVVKRGDGTLEDPSRVLGMHVPANRAHLYNGGTLNMDIDGEDPASACGAWIGADPLPGEMDLTFSLTPAPGGGWKGTIRIPLTTGRALFTQSSAKPTENEAVKGAINLATKALNSPAAQALLPPPAKLALNVLKSPAARQIASAVLKVGKFW